MAFIFSSLGAGEIVLVLVVALLLFGAEKLPALARTLGRSLAEMRQAAEELKGDVLGRDLAAPVDRHVEGEDRRRD